MALGGDETPGWETSDDDQGHARAPGAAQRELAAFYQSQLTTLETVRTQGLTLFSVMMAASGVLLLASRLSAIAAQFVVFIAALSTVGMVMLFVKSAERRALEIEGRYLRAHSELFGDMPAIEMASWLLDRRRTLAKRKDRSRLSQANPPGLP
ncbi:MAG: hypothetical protein KKE02_21350 [Alphaproteobacteria bacterium]|nr:hypothetical protein [Alphaproteobacteria bacterium]MBU1514419.1 hypothetical protein [Alphaproteobacteria bacterium]MBU2097100.1 hypothetical protein [Alphaproteobacteria bacterium]MBU2153579.1 hypothetical protein [Alphaproteobacteria bacterium]MBU2308618.1 hypothetical protein [Alphaproteobacteria bacterium]